MALSEKYSHRVGKFTKIKLKKIMRKLFILLSVALCSIFASCSDNDNNRISGNGSSDNPLVGTWQKSYTEDGYTETAGWTFKANGTCSQFCYDNEGYNVSYPGTYKYDTPVLEILLDAWEGEVEIFHAEIFGNTLKLTWDPYGDAESEILYRK